MVDGPTVRKNGGGEKIVCQALFNDRILGAHWFVWVSLIESEGSKNI